MQRPQANATAVPGQPNLLLGGFALERLGYVSEEFFVAGQAVRYGAGGPSPPDGSAAVAPEGEAPFRTRIVVVRPIDPAAFDGTVFVEWLNVSGGLDAPADWLMAHREMVRRGYCYVGVSAQRVGIEGGPSLGADMSLKTVDPERYASLSHPGDAFSFDIFSQAIRLIRDGEVLGGLRAGRVIAAGESQSAQFLITYVNAVDPLDRLADGFLLHSRFGGAATLAGGSIADMADGLVPVRLRGDLRAPVLVLITETDLIGGPRPGYHAAREPDGPLLRVWEVAGTAHADNYTIQVGFIDDGHAPIEDLAAAWAPTGNVFGLSLPGPVNFAPQHHYVLQAGIAALERWLRTGVPPAEAPRLSLLDTDPPVLDTDPPVLDTDRLGIARGGVRTPWTDVPVARTSGVGHPGNVFASLFGSGEMFDAARIAALHPGGRTGYLRRFRSSLDEAIAAGFLLPADRAEILLLAGAMFPEGPPQ